jgi:N-hydroxyarylamine O-acetyltransferase
MFGSAGSGGRTIIRVKKNSRSMAERMWLPKNYTKAHCVTCRATVGRAFNRTPEMTDSIDLDSYLHRIGFRGDSRPTLETLRTIHALHPQTIPFENLNPLLRRPVRLDAASLEDKLVRSGRGGYCFEHNLLLRHALEALGYRVTGLAARVLWGAPQGAVTSRTHMLLRVYVDGTSYLADVGFGGLTLTAPLRFATDVEQPTPHEPARITSSGNEFLMQAKLGEAWHTLYRFDLQEQHLIDYELANWYTSAHPRSFFVNGLMVARSDPGRRYTLRNTELSVYESGGRHEHRTLASVAELRDALTGLFQLSLPEGPEVDAALARLATPGPS